MLFAVFLDKSHIWGNFCSWDMGQMFSGNQIAGLFNQTYLQNKSVKYPDSLHVDTSSHKLKFDQKNLRWTLSKMGVASQVTGLWNWLYFKKDSMKWTDILHADANSGKLQVFQWFWVGMVRNEHCHLVDETLKSAISKEWVWLNVNSADF